MVAPRGQVVPRERPAIRGMAGRGIESLRSRRLLCLHCLHLRARTHWNTSREGISMLKPQLKNSPGPSEGGVSKGQMLWKGRFQTPSHLFIFILNSRKWVIPPRRRPRSWAGSRGRGWLHKGERLWPRRRAVERREVPDSLVIYLFFTTRNVTVNNSYLNHISKGMTWMKVTINMIACPVDIH